jgi:hypothetical protein
MMYAITNGGIGLDQHRGSDNGGPLPLSRASAFGSGISADEAVGIMTNPVRSDSAVQTTG